MSYTIAGGQISNDDEIQFLYETAPKSVPCEMCNADLSKQSINQRQAHYERHLSDSEPGTATTSRERDLPNAGTSGKPRNSTNPSFKMKEYWRKPETDTFWYLRQMDSKPPPPNFSPGLIPVLRRALVKSHAKGKTQRAVLCYDRTVHVAREFWDASWGCGYRNFLMACTALMDQPIEPMYFPLLDGASPPSVRNLQHLIETAWKDGYDREGAQDLKHKLVGTSKWIGTAEIYTAFTYCRIPSALVDFDLKTQDKGKGVMSVIDWVVRYFSPPIPGKIKTSIDDVLRGASPVICTDKMPLILQHAGHSRTIIGYEINQRGVVNLLTFDPSKLIKKPLRNAGLASLTSASTNSSSSHQDRPQTSSGVLQHILHPVRGSGRTSSDTSTRAQNENEVIVIDNEPSDFVGRRSNQGPKSNPDDRLDPLDIVGFFRLDPGTLERKNQYQILYFPLDPPLTPHEQSARKEVHSTKVRC